MGKLTLSMAIFNSFLYVYQRVVTLTIPIIWRLSEVMIKFIQKNGYPIPKLDIATENPRCSTASIIILVIYNWAIINSYVEYC